MTNKCKINKIILQQTYVKVLVYNIKVFRNKLKYK